MALALKFITCLILTAFIAASVDAAITCGSVATTLAPCIPYLKGGGAVPPLCCKGVGNLNSAAKTTPDRQQACRCLQSTARGIPGIKPNLASGLPGKCGVNIGYPISLSTDCNKVK